MQSISATQTPRGDYIREGLRPQVPQLLRSAVMTRAAAAAPTDGLAPAAAVAAAAADAAAAAAADELLRADVLGARIDRPTCDGGPVVDHGIVR